MSGAGAPRRFPAIGPGRRGVALALPCQLRSTISAVLAAGALSVVATSALAAGAQEPLAVPTGESLFLSKGCTSCHGDGKISLKAAAEAYSEADIEGLLENPPAGMPALSLTGEERLILVKYVKATFGPRGEADTPESGKGE